MEQSEGVRRRSHRVRLCLGACLAAWVLGLTGCVPVVYSPAPGPEPAPPRYEPPRPQQGALDAGPDRVEFGRLGVGESRTERLTVRNRGGGALWIREVSLGGRGFELEGERCRGRKLEAGQSCTVEVRFSPTSAGHYSGALEVEAGGDEPSRLRVMLAGEARGSGRADLWLEPAQLDFGAVDQGEERTLEVEARNDGRSDLRVRQVGVEGAGFGVARDDCSHRTVSPGRSCRLTVRFAPQARGAHFGKLSVSSNDPDESRQSISLRGDGVGAAAGEIRIDPQDLDFGALEVGAERLLPLEVRNEGRTDLRVKAVDVDGRGFEARSDRCSGSIVRPGRSCEVVVRFAPREASFHQGRVVVVSSDRDERRVEVSAVGRGVRSRPPEARFEPGRLDFGKLEVGKAKVTEAEIRNEGGQNLEIRRVDIEGRGFALEADGCSGRSIPPGRHCAVRVRFEPEGPGDHEGSLRVASNAAEARRLGLSLRGEGQGVAGPEIGVAPPRLDFGVVDAGSLRALPVEIRNGGGSDLRIREVAAEGRGFTVEADGCSGRTVPSDGRCAVRVRFAPEEPGAHSGSLRVLSNDPARAKLLLPLGGSAAKKPAEPAPCAVQRVDLRDERDGRRQAIPGADVPEGGCVTFVVRAAGSRLQACVPEGYEVRAEGMEETAGWRTCRVPGTKAKYRAYRKDGLRDGADFAVTLVRGKRAPGRVRVLFESGDSKKWGND